MTLHEIEETLRTLSSRHKGMDEGMLVTLLRAGGWEEKYIQEAVLVFRSGVSLDEELLQAPIEEDHRIEEHAGVVAPTSQVQEEKEKESLVVASEAPQTTDDLPHNLPLRPFETSDHVWPFSRYRDVFYGDVEIPHVEQPPSPPPTPAPEPVSLPVVPPPPVSRPGIVEERRVREQAISDYPPTQQHTHGEIKLIVTASVMLLTILLLLGYMYSNGRL